jgi:DNA invertase Pin-like site-specific DNA recombinase
MQNNLAGNGDGGLAEALEFLRQGTLVVWKLDRLGRSLRKVTAKLTVL